MIIKSFSLNYEKLFEDYKIIHVYGENFHLKNEIINKVSNIYKKNDYKVRIIKEDALKIFEVQIMSGLTRIYIPYLQDADVNKDYKISYDEFKNMVSKLQEKQDIPFVMLTFHIYFEI